MRRVLTARTGLRGLMVLGLGLGLAGCSAYDGEIVHGYQIDQKVIDQVRVGSAAEQVLVVLGTPTTTSTVGGDAWYYVSQKTKRTVAFMEPALVDQRVVAIYFDNNKRVERVANYGMEDGKIIDFVTRTTPTGGGEESFIRNVFKNLLRFN